MQKLASIVFTTNGTGHCLYHEHIPLHNIGRLECTRASHLEFNASRQLWEVRVSSLPTNNHVAFSSPSRATCLEWERENLQPTIVTTKPSSPADRR